MSLPKEFNVALDTPPAPQASPKSKSPLNGTTRKCPDCNVYYKRGSSYWQHVHYVHARFLIQCLLCKKTYKRMHLLKRHFLHKHKIPWQLSKNFFKKIKKSELSENNDLKTSSVDSNKVVFYKKKTLHLISSFNCYNCPGSFKTVKELFQHVRSHRKDFKFDEIDSDYENLDRKYKTELKFQNKTDAAYTTGSLS